MAQQANFVQETVSSIENDLVRMQKRMKARRKKFEKETQKRVQKFEKEIRKNSYFKRAQGFVDDASKQIEKGVDSVFGALNLATKREVGRIDRKLNQINRKLRDIEKAKPGNGAAKPN
jgi:uncharacterized coiled-coil DUF342 family protein